MVFCAFFETARTAGEILAVATEMSLASDATTAFWSAFAKATAFWSAFKATAFWTFSKAAIYAIVAF